MRRVAITGLGAVTPLGLDAPSTWDAAVSGRSGVGWIEAFDASGYPVRIAAEVRGFDPGGPSPRRRRGGWTGTSSWPSPPRSRHGTTRAWTGTSTARASGSSSARRSAGSPTIAEQQQVLADRGRDRVSPFFIPSVLVDTASGQIAIQLGIAGPNYAPVSACATGSTAIGEGAETIRRGEADVVLAGGTEAPIIPLILAGFCAMRGPRRRGGGSDGRVAPVRRDARRVRDGGGGVHPRARGPRRGARARGDDLRGGARVRRLERRAPSRPARAGGDRGRADDRARRSRPRASSPGASGTSMRTEPRRRSATLPRRARSSRSSATTLTSWPSRRRSP